MKSKSLLIGLGALGLLAFFSGSSGAAPALVSPAPPPPPPTPPTPTPTTKPPVLTKPPKAKAPAVDIGPAIIEETPLPSGWIPTAPTAEIQQIQSDMEKKLLSSPAGTSFPFQIGNKNYFAIVVMDSNGRKTIAILQPENQL